jgi:hypothetical protein
MIHICYIEVVPSYEQILAAQQEVLDQYYCLSDVIAQQPLLSEPIPNLAEQLETLLTE